ncbi:MAG: hypothetical protein NTZ33_13090 [Bacteroidetes bacterium]|nr:hypothetical protein [Bacteroidota bacterium]
MKKIILTTIIAFSVTLLVAQYKGNFNYAYSRPLNNINLGILGDASLFSVNYERLFLNRSNSFFCTAGMGLGANPEISVFGPAYLFFAIPHHITANIGYKKHFFEVGIGGVYIYKKPNWDYINYMIAGLRIQPLESNDFYFRIYGCTTINDIKTGRLTIIPIGLSFGISF